MRRLRPLGLCLLFFSCAALAQTPRPPAAATAAARRPQPRRCRRPRRTPVPAHTDRHARAAAPRGRDRPAAQSRAGRRGGRGQPGLGRDARAHRPERDLDQRRPDARLRHRVEHHRAGDRLRGGRRARPDPHQPPRRDPGPGDRGGDLPQPRGSAAVPGVPRPGARLRHLPLRPEEAALHQAQGAAAVPGRGAGRARDPRGRQQRRRAAVDPRRHARAPGSRRARIRGHQVQRLQHVLPAGRLGHLRGLLRLPGHRYPRPRRGTQCRRREWRGLELLPAARTREARAGAHPAGQAGAARHALHRLQLHPVR